MAKNITVTKVKNCFFSDGRVFFAIFREELDRLRAVDPEAEVKITHFTYGSGPDGKTSDFLEVDAVIAETAGLKGGLKHSYNNKYTVVK